MDLKYDIACKIAKCWNHPQLIPDDRHVTLVEQSNAFCLRPVSEVAQFLNVSNSMNYMYIKQRSDEWKALQNQVKIIASTFGKAIGLQGLQAQKEHHHVYINGRDPPGIGPEIQAMMDYGIKYEIHGICTLVGQIMPLLLPPCHAFFEVGCLVSDLESVCNFIAVSPDGIIECTQGNDTCKHKSIKRHKRIMVEVKSPFPQEHLPEEPYYEVPTQHVPQLLCQMYFFKSDVSGTNSMADAWHMLQP